MKKNLFLLTLLGGFLYVILSSHSAGPAAIASLERTGLTGPGGCGGATCHGTTPSPFISDTVLVLNAAGSPVSFYVPGAVYTFRVRGINSSSSILPKFGYQLTAVKAGTPVSAGTLLPGTGTHTAVVSGVTVSEQSHSLWCTGTGGSGTVYQVDIQWVAPAAGTGTVALRAIVNAIDTNGTAGAEDLWPPPGPIEYLPEEPTFIFGPATVCTGATTSLSASLAGGTWTSSDPLIASISSTGTVTGIAPGVVYIMYATATSASGMSVTVNPTPEAIAGIQAVCQGGTSTLTDATPGGTWVSSDPSVAIVGSATGVVAGATAAGTATITYKMTGTTCNSTMSFTVALTASVTGTPGMCAGTSATFSHPYAGGIWYSSDLPTATVSSSGLVDAVAPGTSIISYSLSTTGCDAEKAVTINGTPSAAISGTSTVCLDHTATLTGSPAGGTWSSSDASKVTVGASSGVVTGVANGTATIQYNVTGACGTGSTTSVITAGNTGLCLTATGNPFNVTNELRLFPNPNKGSFSLNILASADDNAHIVITNIVGAKVQEFTIKTNEVNVIAINQPPGIYFLSATTLGSKYFVKLIVE